MYLLGQQQQGMGIQQGINPTHPKIHITDVFQMRTSYPLSLQTPHCRSLGILEAGGFIGRVVLLSESRGGGTILLFSMVVIVGQQSNIKLELKSFLFITYHFQYISGISFQFGPNEFYGCFSKKPFSIFREDVEVDLERKYALFRRRFLLTYNRKIVLQHSAPFLFPIPHSSSIRLQSFPLQDSSYQVGSAQVKYNDFIMMMYRNSAMEQADSMQRDALISMLKKELYELQDKEHEFIVLNDEINTVEAKYSMIKDEKDRIENQHRIKVDINRKNIAELRAQIDNIKMQIHRCSVQIEDILRDTDGVKRMCNNRESEIASQMAFNQELDAKNDQLSEENKAQVNRIKNLKDERNRCDIDNERLHKALEEGINSLKALEKQARLLDADNSKLNSFLVMAEKDYSELIEEAKSKDELVGSSNKKLDQLNREIEELKDKTNRLEKEYLKNEQEMRNTTEALELAISKNKEQTKRLKVLQGNLRGVENELDRAIIERDGLQNDHAALSAEHNLLNQDIDALMIQIIECEKVNKQLQREIENYIQSDEDARSMLNRRDAMRNMLDIVTAKLTQTGEPIAHLRG